MTAQTIMPNKVGREVGDLPGDLHLFITPQKAPAQAFSPKELLISELREAVAELNLIKQGKGRSRPAAMLLNEL